MAERSLSVLDGNTFVVSDKLGDVRADTERDHGFFSEDTRFVSQWSLRINGAPLDLLGMDQDAHFAVQLFLAPRVAPDESAPCSVMRRRCVDRVWLEEITVVNHRGATSTVRVELDVDTDFADLFEVKNGTSTQREVTWHEDGTSLVLEYERNAFHRSVTIAVDRPAAISRRGFTFERELARGETWTVAIRVTPHAAQTGTTFAARTLSGSLTDVRSAKDDELEQWLAHAPALEAQHAGLARTYRASLTDLAALRLQPDLGEPGTLPAAGLPWFMALFGRDSLIASFQALPYLPTLAAATLRVLATRQAQNGDDFHDAEPGKILHELRLDPPSGWVGEVD